MALAVAGGDAPLRRLGGQITLYFFLVAWAEIEAGAPDAGNAVILAVIYFMIALLPLPVIFGVMRAVGWALRRFWRASDRP